MKESPWMSLIESLNIIKTNINTNFIGHIVLLDKYKLKFNNSYSRKLYYILYDYLLNNNYITIGITFNDMNFIDCHLILKKYKKESNYMGVDYSDVIHFVNICNYRPELIESLLIDL